MSIKHSTGVVSQEEGQTLGLYLPFCRGSFQEPEKSGLLGGQESCVLRVPQANIGQAGHLP